ncbi:unnamed protein product [Soboliphyme baturini]|uniref:CBFD_NFYB_HMF domain-containing protein n=1 Tax=Soboliphyme baturini TaxID=241478 RepID=A0A183IMA5_9BILA|nr:unnamed protein product [Soboliphyme baturini]
MKLDEEVKAQMISAEAPILLAKAAEMFIEELTLRAWVHTEDGKRKTLQKSDISKAVSKYDQFDFLIDIIPREEVKVGQVVTMFGINIPQMLFLFNFFFQMDATSTAAAATANTGVTMGPEQMQYFLQLGGLTTSVSTSSSNALSLTTAAAATQSTIPQTVQLQGGQLLHATQIGQPIQLITGAGDIQVIEFVRLKIYSTIFDGECTTMLFSSSSQPTARYSTLRFTYRRRSCSSC